MAIAVIYFIGVIVGLTVMRDPWPSRLATALVWPLGPAAFVVVISVLLVASLILWPLVMVPAAGLIAALVWWLT